MADIHLHCARLFRDKKELKRARALIEQCGYWRRKQELDNTEPVAVFARADLDESPQIAERGTNAKSPRRGDAKCERTNSILCTFASLRGLVAFAWFVFRGSHGCLF